MMSSAKQAMLQSLLKEGFAASSKSPAQLDPALLEGIEARLLPMGFSQQQVLEAATALSGRAAVRATGSVSKSEAAAELALDWLFIHLPSDQMPRQYRTGGLFVMQRCPLKGYIVWLFAWKLHDGMRSPQCSSHVVFTATSTVAVISSNIKREACNPRSDKAPGSVEAVAEAEGHRMDSVLRLGAFGYTPSECSTALAESQGKELVALQELYRGLTGMIAWMAQRLLPAWIQRAIYSIQSPSAPTPPFLVRLQGYCPQPRRRCPCGMG
jgi:hypothetical protein